MGDFNLPEITWSLHDCLFLHYPPLAQMFLDTFSVLCLTQWVKDSSFFPSGNILDLVLTTEDDGKGDLEVPLPFRNCGHYGIVFDYNSEFEFTSEFEKK